MRPLLAIEGLKTHFQQKQRCLKAVDGINLSIYPGETVALVGESGSGKTVTLLSILKLVAAPGKIVSGKIFFKGQDLTELSQKALSSVRGKQIGLISQDPLAALNPLMPVGKQIAEVSRYHLSLSRSAAKKAALALMEQVHLPNAEAMYKAYPHELSGGQRQRVLIAIALAGKPDLLIADEPTTALDVSIQSQILILLKQLKRELNLSILLITHDMSVVAQMADRVAVMYAGKIVEQAATRDLFLNPLHPYTKALLNAIPRVDFSRNNHQHFLKPLYGSVPDLVNMPEGCPFHPRCDVAEVRCRYIVPPNVVFHNYHHVQCLKRNESIAESA